VVEDDRFPRVPGVAPDPDTSAGKGARTVSKAFRFHAHGGPDVLRLEEVEVGAPGRGEVRIRNTAVAVNYRDVLMRQGVHAVKALPSGIGLESAGVIDAVGPEVEGFAVGDRVAYAGMPEGSYAELRIVPAARLIPLPADIDERTAASMMIRGMTARSLLCETYRVQPGDTILLHAAAGGVGLIMCQWAKQLGATVIGTVSSEEKAAVARAHGCDHAIVYSREDFVARVRDITGGEGVPVVYDSVGKATFEGSLQCLRRRGVMASFGEASGDPDPVPPRRLGALGSIYLTHPSVSNYTVTRAELLKAAGDLFAMVADGKIRIEISRSYPLRDAARAHADMESRRTTGSIVLVV
jgi:NADPH:quinone reductase